MPERKDMDQKENDASRASVESIVMSQRCWCGQGCDSQLECMFWHFMRKTENGLRGTEPQKQFGRFRVDAFVECHGRSVIVELDGKQFHNAERDRRRDAIIRESVDAIIRIPFPAMWYYSRATFEVLAKWFPRFRIAKDVNVYTRGQLFRELDRIENGRWTGWTRDEYLELIESSYEVWGTKGRLGYVGSPKAFLHEWNLSPIVLST